MASEEAVDYLKQGSEAWNNYVLNRKGVVDLKFADLVGCDLRKREFSGCDLTGAQLTNANLDGTTFVDSLLTGAQLTNASLVGSVWRSVTATRANLSNAVVRNCRFSAVRFTDTQVSGLTLAHCELRECHLTNMTLDSSQFEDALFIALTSRNVYTSSLNMVQCRFVGTTRLSDWVMQACELVECTFANAEIARIEWTGGKLVSCALVHCTLQQPRFEKVAVSQLDLSSSLVKYADVAQLGPASAVLLNTSFVGCTWPPQAGSVSFTGKYAPSIYLLAQPVQDVYGLSPTLRRTIGDAQYLVRTLADAKNPRQRFIFRFWGASCAFGQSISRLTAFSLLIVLVHTAAISVIRGGAFNLSSGSVGALAQAFADVGQAFLGFGTSVFNSSSISENAVMLSARIAGFLCLGLWISIASIQISRLSSY